MSRKNVMQEEKDLFEDRKFINKMIDRIDNKFSKIEDIDLENLRVFLIILLLSFQEKKFSLNDILNILDVLEIYIHRRYMDDYPETCYPNPSDNDPISIGLNAIDYINEGVSYGNLLPNIMNPLLNYLNTPKEKEKEATFEMRRFMQEFVEKRKDTAERHPNGSYTITWDQLEKG